MTDFIWNGGGDGVAWSDPANWDVGSGFPDDNGDRAIFNATASAVVTGAARTIGELQINVGFIGTVTLTVGALTIDDAGAHDGSMNVDDGTFDANDLDIDIDGNFDTASGGTIVMGAGSVWTCGGNWNSNPGIKTRETSTVKMTGTGKTFETGTATADRLHDIEIAGTITAGPVIHSNNLTVSGTLTIPTGETWSQTGGTISVSSSGTIDGVGDFTTSGSVVLMTGSIAMTGSSTVTFKPASATRTYSPGTYGAGLIHFNRTGGGGGTRDWQFDAGTFTFNGDVKITMNKAGNASNMDHSTNNPTISITGDLTIEEIAGTLNYNKSTNPLTLSGSALQAITSIGKDLEDLVVTNTSAGGVTFADAIDIDKITAAATSSNILIKFDETGAHTVDEFDLSGSGANRVQLRSEVDANQWDVTTVGNQSVDHADVKDSNMNGGTYTVTDGTDSGNNSANWVFVAVGFRSKPVVNAFRTKPIINAFRTKPVSA